MIVNIKCKILKTITINGQQGDSQIFVGESFKNFKNYLPTKQVVVITDEVVNKIYGSYFAEYPIIEIGLGEKSKTLETVSKIVAEMLRLKIDRKGFVLAVGGGIVTDIAGFVASIYQRGIDFGFVSGTLLSQVDASVGGKNGVNFEGYKNMIGNFNQPKFVICDPQMLTTLHPEQLDCGFAEIVKHTLIADKAMFEFLEMNAEKALSLDFDVIERLVDNSITIKANVVNKDEKEHGERRKLNLGHTFGHAAEKVLGVSHGYAVSLGLVVAARLSEKRGLLTSQDVARIVKLLETLKLPTVIVGDKQAIYDALEMDKKRDGSQINFVLMNGIGDVVVEKIDINELKQIEI